MNKPIRRTKEELKQKEEEAISSKFKLKEQKNFKGSPDLLEYMQKAERYYREGKPILTDLEWDKLVKETGYEESLDDILSPNGRRWHKLKAPLVSLKNAATIEQLLNFINKFPKGQEFIVSPKFDGLTYCLVYKEIKPDLFKLSKITTRGDGMNALEIFPNALFGVELKGVPDFLNEKSVSVLRNNDCVIDGVIEIRGEAIINKNDYSLVGAENNYNDIVPRSIAAGILNRETPNNLAYISSLFPKNIIWEEMTHDQKKILSKYGIIHYRGRIKEDSSPYDICDIENGEFIVRFRGENTRINFAKGQYTGKTRFKEIMYFASFSVASKYGNIEDPDILNNIDGIIYGNNIEDFKGISCITSDVNKIIKSVDLLYGTTNGVRDPNKVRLRSKLRFSTDGIVLKPLGSNTETQGLKPKKNRAGYLTISKYPLDQIAIKLPSEKSKTRLLKINEITTRLGNKTCTADIEPTIVEGGAIVSRVNLHNPSWLSLPENSWIKESVGKECYVEMAMDIIPVLSPLNDSK